MSLARAYAEGARIQRESLLKRHEATFELKLSNGKRVTWTGYDGIDAARRYVDAHRGASVIAWRIPRVDLTVGIPWEATTRKRHA